MARKKSSHIEENVKFQQHQEAHLTQQLTALSYMFFHCFLYRNDENTEEKILAWSNAAQSADKCPDKCPDQFGDATSALLELFKLVKEKNETIMQ